MKFSNLNCKLRNFSETENSNLLKVKMLILHDGENKKSKISLDSIKRAEETIKNIPILAHIKEDGEDFDEHNIVLKKVESEDGLKYVIRYVEKPIGLIPSETEIEYEEIDGRTYLSATGYIWKRYSNEGYDIIMDSESKGVSMEIEILDGEVDKEDGIYDIKDFNFLGVTVLGDDIEPGMYDTKLEKYSLSKLYKKELEDIYKEIYSLKDGKEEDFMEEQNLEVVEEVAIVEEVVAEEVEKVEEVIEEQQIEEVVEEVETFSLSSDDMYMNISQKLRERKIEFEDYWGDKQTIAEFYIVTILPEDKIAIVGENANYSKYHGLPYEIKGDDIELNYEGMAAYIQEWRPKQENEEVMSFSKEDEMKDVVLEKFSKKESELEGLKKELASLQEFKSDKEKEELVGKVEEVVNEFDSLQDEEVEVFKAKALEGEIGLKELKKELYCLVGMKTESKKEKFSADKEEIKEVKVMDVEVFSNDKVTYGGLFEKHGIQY